jgi:arylsulfatase A-like enzyme
MAMIAANPRARLIAPRAAPDAEAGRRPRAARELLTWPLDGSPAGVSAGSFGAMSSPAPVDPASSVPDNVVVVLLDSLNRHLLGAYGGTEFETPNLDAFAQRAVRFTEHHTGSLPCMPARHDLLCGALDFLWKPWGSIEIWEDAITRPLRAAGVTTQLVSDHPHLFETGGENYHVDFSAWDYQRGHENDPWKTVPDPSWIGAPSIQGVAHNYDNSRGWFRGEPDFPGPRTMAAAADWVDRNAGRHDRFLLVVDEFDPHEPFDTPDPYASMYDPDWDGPHLIWPPYVRGGVRKGVIDERQGRQIRAQYGAKLTMIDHWFGRLIDAVDRHGLGSTTAVIVCTDHGHYLGEDDTWGKPAVPVRATLGHIPLLVAWPGASARACAALTTSVDLFATIADVFDVEVRQRTHGRSLVPLLDGTATEIRDWVLTGVWGREVHLVDKTRRYCRAPAGDNAPLSMWSNRWSTMPVGLIDRDEALPLPDARAVLDHMPGSDLPVIRQPWDASDRLPFWAWSRFSGSALWDRVEDPDEERDLLAAGTGGRAGSNDIRIGSAARAEADAAERLRTALVEMEAPGDQLVRLGLS